MAEPDTDTEPDGLRVVLTPIQLAALLQGATLHRGPTLANRFWGAFAVLGGAVELLASVPLWLAPEPTTGTKVAAAALDAVGADTAATGLREVWTGRRTMTLTATALRASLRALGVEEDVADRLATGTEVAIDLAASVAAPVAVARTAEAARVLSISRGAIDLEVEEALGGHTIAKHVGKDEAWLRARLAGNPNLTTASSFRTLRDAERASRR